MQSKTLSGKRPNRLASDSPAITSPRPLDTRSCAAPWKNIPRLNATQDRGAIRQAHSPPEKLKTERGTQMYSKIDQQGREL
jgi:hypothetical protein